MNHRKLLIKTNYCCFGFAIINCLDNKQVIMGMCVCVFVFLQVWINLLEDFLFRVLTEENHFLSQCFFFSELIQRITSTLPLHSFNDLALLNYTSLLTFVGPFDYFNVTIPLSLPHPTNVLCYLLFSCFYGLAYIFALLSLY